MTKDSATCSQTTEGVHADRCPASIHQPATPSPPFRFLDLPGEIQNHIVDDFIVSSHPIIVHQPRFNRHRSPPPKPRSRPRFDRHVPPTPPLSRSTSTEDVKPHDAHLGHTRLALMLTCRKLYREHWRTYYGENVFEFDLDTFVAFIESIPKRCLPQLRRIKFCMPHKHHHGRIWNFLAALKRLEELELQFCPTSQTEPSEYEQAIEGAKHCNRLVKFTLSRAAEDKEDESADQIEAVRAEDCPVEERIRKFLTDREEKRRDRSRSRSRPGRTSVDGDFPANESEA